MKDMTTTRQFTDYFTDFAQKWVPDSYVIALVLTLIAFIMAFFSNAYHPVGYSSFLGKRLLDVIGFCYANVLDCNYRLCIGHYAGMHTAYNVGMQ